FGVYRPHRHAVDLTNGDAAAGPVRRAALSHRGIRAVGCSTRQPRSVRERRDPLLAAPVSARPGDAKPGKRWNCAWHLFAENAGRAKSDRHVHREAGFDRGWGRDGTRLGLPRWDATARPEARSSAVHADRAAAAG